ncbi:aladin [Drosophila virilis]|uniref:Uncharacterized protein n=1 Tax=Drosophila virilis TaxID=7244 RepID=B4MAF3_DROVI|nr:aladin [Drosophila virilis]EDW66212.1 uncharacterized protein Dvir_GJ15900 [Drosophila virilis]
MYPNNRDRLMPQRQNGRTAYGPPVLSFANRMLVVERLMQRLSGLWLSLSTHFVLVRKLFDLVFGRLKSWVHIRLGRVPPTVRDLAASIETCNWPTASIRYIACHPTGMERALLTSMDVALLYSDMRVPPQRLTSAKQRHVTCAAFRPWSSSELAVGGAGGICLWKPLPTMPRMMQITWYGYKPKDFIVDLQWLQTGTHLVSATLGNRRIQIWHPELRQLMQELHVPQPGTHCWVMRYQSDILHLISFLKSDAPILRYRNSLKTWSSQLTKRMPIQTAAWTARGNHLMYVVKGSSKVYGSTSSMVMGPFRHPFMVWSTSEVIDLRSFYCNWQQHEGGLVQSMVMDPLNVYVAFMFKRRPFVLLCLLHIPFNCSLKLKPMQLIQSADGHPDAFPTCITFGFMDRVASHRDRSLVIGWSTGRLQIEELIAQTREEALLFEELEIRHPQQVFEIDLY